jgi:hypothetical protein
MSNIIFSSFLKPQLKVDTIPKPVGLGSHGRREGTGCSVLVRHISGNLFGICSVV